MEIKKNLPIIVALGLPLLLVLVIAVAAFLPSWGQQPTYDFVYTTQNYRSGGYYYDVKNEKVVKVEIETTNPEFFYGYKPVDPELYYFDVETKTSKVISLDEAKKYNLDEAKTSPDGFMLKETYRGGGFFWFDYGGSGYTQALVGHSRQVDTDIHDYGAQLLGWVKK